MKDFQSNPLPLHQRTRGQLGITTKTDTTGKTHLDNLRQAGSYRALFPRQRAQQLEAVIINTAGGITGGDRYTISATTAQHSALTLTTQAAERVYDALDDTVGQLQVDLKVADDARLNWLPQETILFDGCGLNRRLNVALGDTAQFLMVEPLVFGRQASGEHTVHGQFRDQVHITRNGVPIYYDAIKLTGDMTQQLRRTAIGDGATAMANIVLCSPLAPRHLDQIRAMLPDTAGASLFSDTNVLVIRALAADSFVLRKIIVPILNILTQESLPKTWRL